MVAGHISPWARDKKNRLNLANGICLCVLHDRAFETGAIVLDQAQKVILNPRLVPSSALYRNLKAAEGHRIEAVSPYFSSVGGASE